VGTPGLLRTLRGIQGRPVQDPAGTLPAPAAEVRAGRWRRHGAEPRTPAGSGFAAPSRAGGARPHAAQGAISQAIATLRTALGTN